MAPELINNKNSYSYKNDVWSLGILIYYLLIGKTPFIGENIEEIYESIKKGKYSFPNNFILSDSSKDLIKKLLEINPTKRLTIEEIFFHDFFKTNLPKSMPLSTLKDAPTNENIFLYKDNINMINVNSNTGISGNERDKIFEEIINQKSIKDLKMRINELNNLLLEEKKLSQQLLDKIYNLENQLNIERNKNIDEKSKNKDLNEKIKELNKFLKNNYNKDDLLKLMSKYITQEEEIQELKSRFPFEILKDDKIISIIFTSTNQEIHYSFICKDNDKFINVENLLYEQYPKYRETENYFMYNGNKISKYKSLKENNIQNSSIIILNQID